MISAGGFTGYSWTDHHDADHRSLLPAAESHGLVVGSDVDLFYDVCHPSRWGLTPPKQDNAAWTLGWILTGVGHPFHGRRLRPAAFLIWFGIDRPAR